MTAPSESSPLRALAEPIPQITEAKLIELATSLMNCSRADNRGMMAGTTWAAASHDEARRRFYEAVKSAPIGVLADAFLDLDNVRYENKRLLAERELLLDPPTPEVPRG